MQSNSEPMHEPGSPPGARSAAPPGDSSTARPADPPGPRIHLPSSIPSASAELFGRDAELAQLDAAWRNEATHVIAYIAWGGAGKTALVGKWLAGLAKRDYDDARMVYYHTFYSQGSGEDKQGSSDLFFAEALEFFGAATIPESPRERGLRLAALVQQARALLVLDGLEPLQHASVAMRGRLKDPALLALLQQLAAKNPGLCIVTSRLKLTDLQMFGKSTFQENELDKGGRRTAEGARRERQRGRAAPSRA